MSITFKVYGYAGVSNVQAKFDAESDTIKTIVYDEKASFKTFGTFGTTECTLKSGLFIIHRDFHLQPMINNKNCGEAFYSINVVTGGIGGNPTSEQNSKFFNIDGKEYVMNYGVSHASDEKPAKLKDQAYLYISTTKRNWMAFLDAEKNMTVSRLVLPGAHDAGMWKVDEDFLAEVLSSSLSASYFATFFPLVGLLLASAGVALSKCIPTILYNVAVTQKDSISDLLKMGIRHFDFRPAKFKPLLNKVVHVHGPIPGGSFDEFLNQVNNFINNNRSEVVFVEIKDDGITSEVATFISKQELTDIADRTLNVKFHIFEENEVAKLNKTKWSDLKSNFGQIIFLYKANTKSSYNDPDYSYSMTDPNKVNSAVTQFLKEIDSSCFNLIQTQNTATNFLKNNWKEFITHPSWINDIALSDTGSPLADTKALFDGTLYQTLANAYSQLDLKQNDGLTAIINDFADIGLVDLSIQLTKTRLES